MNEIKIYGELIWRLAKKGKFALVKVLVEKLKKEGKFYLFKNIINYLKEKYSQEMNIVEGKLILAFSEGVEEIINLLERKVKKKIKVKEIEVNENLILGGMFISKNIKIDFSLKNLINKFSQQWMI